MTLLIIFLCVVFTVASLYFTLAPFLGGHRANVRAEYLDEEVRELEQLVAKRTMLLAALRELEFEFETDKIGKSDYDQFKVRYEREAVNVMRRLDELHGGRGWEEKIDEAVEARLGRPPRSSSAADTATESKPQTAPDREERHEESVELEATT